jgi:hypothetical protein
MKKKCRIRNDMLNTADVSLPDAHRHEMMVRRYESVLDRHIDIHRGVEYHG